MGGDTIGSEQKGATGYVGVDRDPGGEEELAGGPAEACV